jgi:hypothetical protein
MDFPEYDDLVNLDFAGLFWTHFFTISPLVLIGTRDDGRTEFKQ